MIVILIYFMITLCCHVIQAETTMIHPRFDFRSPKNIGFNAVGGGSSHYFWVLEILQELTNRGHQATLFTRANFVQFAKDYQDIPVHTVGGDYDFIGNEVNTTAYKFRQHRPPNPDGYVRRFLPSILANYSNEYIEFREIIKSKKIDIMLCDMLALACIDAATNAKIPLITTSTMTYSRDSRTSYMTNSIPFFNHPTIESMSMYERLRYLFYGLYLPYRIKQFGLPAHDFQMQHGIPLTTSIDSAHTKHAVKLVNNMFGLEATRPMGPLVQLIGPILRHKYPKLTSTLATFLGSRSRVAYIAFGQHVVPTEEDTVFLVTALSHAVEQGHLDGILWATGKLHPVPRFPSTINKDTIVTGWAPQFSILQHPSVALFVTHGGTGSVHEALFNKVKLFVYPFFGDQPLTARLVRQSRLGDYIDTSGMVYSNEVLVELIERMLGVLTDPSIHQAVLHYGNAVQVRSLHAVQHGADIVEETAFGAIGDTVPHLMDIGNRLGWIKKYNIDILVVVMIVVGAFWWLLVIFSHLFKTPSKMKTM